MSWYIAVLKKYAVFEGRSRRKEYWFYALFTMLISIALTLLDIQLGWYQKQYGIGTLNTIYGVAVLIPGLAVSVRRLHDIGKSGFWLFIALIPFIGAIILLVFMVRDSDPGDNQYGPNPKTMEPMSEPA